MILRKCCLLIGNTRWHWAIQERSTWRFLHTDANTKILKDFNCQLWKWAAVGSIPQTIHLEEEKCIKNSDIPLLKLPNWVGIDRALAGWEAFQKAKAKNLHSKGILIADAGTILSMTRITSNGEFAGGQLIAGLQLQLKAMATGTKNLKTIQHVFLPKHNFPICTEEAMLQGSFQALLGAILKAQKKSNMPLWLCGGDSKIFYKHLKKYDLDLHHCPNLGLEAMIKINL